MTGPSLQRTFALVAALCLWALPAAAQSLYWIDTNYGAPTLNRANADGAMQNTVALAVGTLPEGLAVASTGEVYWAESAWSNARVNRSFPNLTGITAIRTGGSVFRGIAVDDVDDVLYITSSNLVNLPRVHRATFDGSTFVNQTTWMPDANFRGIAVDHPAGKLYWTDFDQNRIFQSNLNGSGVTIWMNLPAGSRPYGIAVDPAGQFVYWTEYGTGLLKRATTSATGVTPLVMGLANPTYLALDLATARMYWSEGGVGSQRIQRATTLGGAIVTLPTPLTTYGGLAFAQAVPAETSPLIEVPVIEFSFDRVWPTPSSGAVHASFSLPREAHARLSVLDLLGREVAVLADGVMPVGRHSRTWDARTRGGAAPAGIYFMRLAVDGRTWVRRLVLTR